MHQGPPHRAWRYIALVSVLANATFNYLAEAALSAGDDLRVVAERYDNLFQPASYAFAIWGVIYAGFLVYAVYALLPSQRHVRVHDGLAIPLTVANVLATLWIVAFRYDHIGASVLVMIATVCNAIPLYMRSRSASLMWRPYERVSCCTGVPFSIYLGWISIAAAANIAIYMRSRGLLDAVLGETTWAVLMLVTAGVLAIALAFRFSDGVLPSVLSWASFAIWVDTRAESATVAAVAFAVGMLAAGAAVYFLAGVTGPPSFRGPRNTRLEMGR